MKTQLLLIFTICSFALAQEVIDVADPSSVKINTPDQGLVVSGNLRDTIVNYPKLKEVLLSETGKKLEAEDEIAAAKRVKTLNEQKVDLPKVILEKHNARIVKFAKKKDDALAAVAKKSGEPLPKIDSKSSELEIAQFAKALNEARAQAVRAKAKKDELVAAGIPISKAAQDAVEAAQAKPTPTPTPAPTPKPVDDGL